MNEGGSASGSGRPGRLEAELARLRQPQPTEPPEPAKGPLSGILARARQLLSASLSDPGEASDDPAQLIQATIAEMEETLGEVRASAARTIADQKEMHRHVLRLERLEADWREKAALALSKNREDLARAALVERMKAGELAAQLKVEVAILDESLRDYEADIDRLQRRLSDARSRQRAIAARLESAQNQIKLRTVLAKERADQAMERFDTIERRVDDAQGRADALSLGQSSGPPDLARQISALADDDPIEAELGALKAGQARPAADREG